MYRFTSESRDTLLNAFTRGEFHTENVEEVANFMDDLERGRWGRYRRTIDQTAVEEQRYFFYLPSRGLIAIVTEEPPVQTGPVSSIW